MLIHISARVCGVGKEKRSEFFFAMKRKKERRRTLIGSYMIVHVRILQDKIIISKICRCRCCYFLNIIVFDQFLLLLACRIFDISAESGSE